MTLATIRGRSSRAFTLIELLLVIGILGVLVAIGLALGNKVTAGGRARLTEDAIRILDKAMEEYTANKAGVPPAFVRDPVKSTTTSDSFMPIVDGINPTPGPNQPGLVNSVGWFLYQVGSTGSSDSVTSVDAILKGLSPKLLKTNLAFPEGGGSPGGPAEGTLKNPVPAEFRTVVDAWGRDLRYVHPTFDGVIDPAELTWKVVGDPDIKTRKYSVAKIQRNPKNKDADGGFCKGGRPYFYSAGVDGDPATTDDNLYTLKPDFKKD